MASSTVRYRAGLYGAAAVLAAGMLAIAGRRSGAPERPPCAAAAAAPQMSPDSAQLVTADIANFWRAADRAAGRGGDERAQIFEALYLRPGSAGLRAWACVRLADARPVYAALDRAGWPRARVDRAMALPDTAAERRALAAAATPAILHSAATNLAAVTARAPRYYTGVRGTTLALDTSQAVTAAVRASFRRLKALDSAAVFPAVYFLIGQIATGGTPEGGAGLLIGAEMYARGPDTPLDELSPWERANTFSLSAVPGTVAHEVAHAQQADLGGHATLLAQALNEGGADFVSELVTADSATPVRHPVHAYTAYGDAHERDLWAEFRTAMHGTDASGWLYDGGRSRSRPADLGYYVGYKICAAYYRRTPDTHAAVRAILASGRDPDGFLRASGYEAQIAAAVSDSGHRAPTRDARDAWAVGAAR